VDSSRVSTHLGVTADPLTLETQLDLHLLEVALSQRRAEAPALAPLLVNLAAQVVGLAREAVDELLDLGELLLPHLRLAHQERQALVEAADLILEAVARIDERAGAAPQRKDRGQLRLAGGASLGRTRAQHLLQERRARRVLQRKVKGGERRALVEPRGTLELLVGRVALAQLHVAQRPEAPARVRLDVLARRRVLDARDGDARGELALAALAHAARARRVLRRPRARDVVDVEVHDAHLGRGLDDAAQLRVDRNDPRAGILEVDAHVARVAVLVCHAAPAAQLDDVLERLDGQAEQRRVARLKEHAAVGRKRNLADAQDVVQAERLEDGPHRKVDADQARAPLERAGELAHERQLVARAIDEHLLAEARRRVPQNRGHLLIVHLDVARVLVPRHLVPVAEQVVERVARDDADGVRHEERVVRRQEGVAVAIGAVVVRRRLLGARRVGVAAAPAIARAAVALVVRGGGLGVGALAVHARELALDRARAALVGGAPDSEHDAVERGRVRAVAKAVAGSRAGARSALQAIALADGAGGVGLADRHAHRASRLAALGAAHRARLVERLAGRRERGNREREGVRRCRGREVGLARHNLDLAREGELCAGREHAGWRAPHRARLP
jgi:hypothetical protein